MVQQSGQRPWIVFLWFEPSLRKLIEEVLPLEGFTVTSVRTAAEVLGLCAREPQPYVVLMDNYHVNKEAQLLAKTVFAEPELHQRARILGMAALRSAELAQFDVYLKLPFNIQGLLSAIRKASARLADDEDGGHCS